MAGFERPKQVVQPGGGCFEAALAGEALRCAAHEQHHAERDDEGDDLEPGDEEAADESAYRSSADPSGGGRHRTVVGAEHERNDDSRQRDDQSNRQVDSARDDHHRHAESGGADDGGLPGDQLEVVAAKELRADEESKDNRDERQAKEWSAGVDDRSCLHLRVSSTGRLEHQRVLGELLDGTRGPEASPAHDRHAIAQAE